MILQVMVKHGTKGYVATTTYMAGTIISSVGDEIFGRSSDPTARLHGKDIYAIKHIHLGDEITLPHDENKDKLRNKGIQ